jgi:hypothetical protein
VGGVYLYRKCLSKFSPDNQMNLKKLHKDTATVWIEKRRNEGKTDQEIYFELTKVYEGKDEIAKHIAQTLTKEQKDEYRTLNNILFFLLILSIIIKIGFGISFGDGYGSFFMITLSVIINIYFAYTVFKFKVEDYKQINRIIILSWISFIFIALRQSFQFDSVLVIDIIFSIVVLALSTFLSIAYSSLQQHKFEKDSNGDFIIQSNVVKTL